ncbi:SufS family cysteine desulfurase [Duganella sp. FT92W]|uniref:cysteine desulfurase n=1 Tax=Pseudoduganella rivuli TaxID=2666085 RepID=A0A7X2INV3_9BURK|nr:family 2A encapsulin nanocompartment cargo protein cysteine desulfurase [Pseudoduganella rivuli]MRV72923.1 SufS family cysteine desulfurase [Pseudoduganella rivuli]
MTIQTPTNNPAPAHVPDEALLNRLAGELFAQWPGAAGIAAGLVGGQSPSAPAASPAIVSAPRPHGVPGAQGVAPSVHAAPAASPAGQGVTPVVAPAGAPAHGSPQSSHLAPQASAPYAAALPQIDRPSPPSGAPSAPYYFIGEASYQPLSRASGLDALAQQATRADDRVTAQAFALPGVDDLRRLLTGGRSFAEPAPAIQPAIQPAQPAYYFEQGGNAPQQQRPQWQGHPAFDVNAVRRDFPILAERVNGKPLAWFDNAATTHKPQAVIDRLAYFYAHENSNIHRAAHELAARATDAYEGARNKVARFLGAAGPNEIIFVRGATEAINLVAQTFGQQCIGAGDEIIVSHLEHHANIVPWQQLAAEKGARLRVIPVDDSGQILLDDYAKLLNPRTRLVAVTQVSNALGTVTPVADIVAMAHRVGARVLVDGAQAVSHMRVDVQALDADFYVFSGHKVFGPTGIGVVYGKADLLAQLPPWQGGGNMIADVTFERTVYHAPPTRFEAGTGNIADAVGLGAALDYLERLGLDNVAYYETALLDYATAHLRAIPGVRLIGTARDKASVASFVLAGYQTEEVGKALNQEGIAVRTGHHCAQPILRRFGVEATVRPSFAFYNTCEEIDRMIAVVRRLAGARR